MAARLRGARFRKSHPELAERFREDERTDRIRERCYVSTPTASTSAATSARTCRSSRLAPRGRHRAVEPVPKKAARLRKKFPGVAVPEVALAETQGTNEFFIDPSQTS